MAPRPTELAPSLKQIPGIKAVIFDVYGTLVISGSGDVGSADTNHHEISLQDALAACGLPASEDVAAGPRLFRDIINRSHAASRDKGIDAPEVDIVAVWKTWLAENGLDPSVSIARQLAVQFEARANPSCTMPGAADLIIRMQSMRKRLGFVSNAQFFTLELLEISLGKTPLALGFESDLSFFSYRFAMAKPGHELFASLVRNLDRTGVRADEAIYVGNDMLNDVWAASEAGLRTALFAGDRRSLRQREDDSRVAGCKPDLVLTELSQLTDAIA